MDLITALVRATGPWAERAACRDAEVEFVGEQMWEEKQPPWVVERLSYCERCPVRRECAEYALETSPTVGIWGGSTTAERNALLPSAPGHRKHEHLGGWRDTYRQGQIEEAAEILEDTFEIRLAAWEKKLAAETRPCGKCGTPFFGPPSRRNCDTCARPPAKVEKVCRQCGVTFMGSKVRVRCYDCAPGKRKITASPSRAMMA